MNLNSGFKEEPGLIELKLKFQIQLVQFAYFLSFTLSTSSHLDNLIFETNFNWDKTSAID